MTVASEACYAELSWTGVETSFSPGFSALDVAHVVLSYRNGAGSVSALTAGTHLTLSKAGATGQAGAISATVITLPAAPGTVIFERVTPSTQSVAFADLLRYSADVHQALHDAAAMRSAEEKRRLVLVEALKQNFQDEVEEAIGTAAALAAAEATAAAGVSASLAQRWASLVGAFVTGTSLSAYEWAVGTFKRGVAGFGSAKDWATYTGGTVDNVEYSAKQYALNSGQLQWGADITGQTHTASAAESGKAFWCTSDDPVTITIPDDLPAKTTAVYIQAGAGIVTLVGSGGAVLHSDMPASTSGVRYSTVAFAVHTNSDGHSADVLVISRTPTEDEVATALARVGVLEIVDNVESPITALDISQNGTWRYFSADAAVALPNDLAKGFNCVFDTANNISVTVTPDSGATLELDGEVVSSAVLSGKYAIIVRSNVDFVSALYEISSGAVGSYAAGAGLALSGNTFFVSGLTIAMFAANVVDTDTALAANSDTRVASQKAIKAYIAAFIAAQDVEVFKGGIDCSANPNYPAADAGHIYRVSVAGKIGGASGMVVEINDRLECFVDGSASGTQAAVGSSWFITQANFDFASPPSIGAVAPAAGTFTALKASALRLAYVAKTANYTINPAADWMIDCTANSFTVTLASAASIGGQQFVIKNSGSGIVTVGGTVDGVANPTLGPGESITIVADGSNYKVI